MNRQRLAFAMLMVGLSLLPIRESRATVHEVQQVGTSFSPDNLTILQGDTVRWIWSLGVHTVTSGDPSSCTPNGLFSEPLDAGHPTVEYTFNSSGVYSYFCIPHCAIGMSGSVTVSTVHEVNQFGLVFDPQDISINVGDTVRWIWNDGNHTVTSGNATGCTPDGLFDEPLTSANQIVEFTFNDPGLVEYYCAPHCSIGMVGSVSVEAVNDASELPGQTRESVDRLLASPNPFYPATTISFELGRSQMVRLELFDASGRSVVTLVDGMLPAGLHTIDWDGQTEWGTPAPSGIYYAKSWTESSSASVILNLIR